MRAVRWGRDSESAVIEKLRMVIDRAAASDSGALLEVCRAALVHSPWEITLIVSRGIQSGELQGEEAEEALGLIREALLAHPEEEWFWPGFKSALIADLPEVFREMYRGRFARMFAEDFEELIGQFRREISGYYSREVRSVTEREKGILGLRGLLYLSEVTDDGRRMQEFVGRSRIDGRVTREEEREIYAQICRIYAEKLWFEAMRWLFMRFSKSCLPLGVLDEDAADLVDRVIADTPEEERSSLMSMTRDALEERAKNTASSEEAHQVHRMANEEWYGLVRKHRAYFSEDYDFIYHVSRLLNSPGEEETVIREMPYFTGEGTRASQEYNDYLMIRAHGVLMLAAPRGTRMFFEKTEPYDSFRQFYSRVVDKCPQIEGLEEQLPRQMRYHLPYVNPSYTVDVDDFLRAFDEAGKPVAEMVWMYMHTYLRSTCPLHFFLNRMLEVLGRERLEQSNLREILQEYRFFGIYGHWMSETGQIMEGVLQGLNVSIQNAWIQSNSIDPSVREQLDDGAVIRFKVSGLDLNRRWNPLMFKSVSRVGERAEKESSNGKLREFLQKLAGQEEVTEEDLQALSRFRLERTSAFVERVEISLLFAEACGTAGENRRTLDEMIELFRRVNNDQFAYRLFKAVPSFRVYPREAYEKYCNEARRILQTLAERVKDPRNLYRIYMETVLSALARYDFAIQCMFRRRDNRPIDLLPAVDGEHYWIQVRRQETADGYEIVPDTVQARFSGQVFFDFLPADEETARAAEELESGEAFVRIVRLRKVSPVLAAVWYDRICGWETLAEELPQESFEEALRAQAGGDFKTLGMNSEQREARLCAANVRMDEMAAELLAYQSEFLVTVRRGSLKAMEELNFLLGPNQVFREEKRFEVRKIRFLHGREHQTEGALRRLLGESQAGSVIGLYFNCFLKVQVDALRFCEMIREQYPEMTQEMLAALFAGHPFEVKEEGGRRYVSNVRCEAAAYEGEGAGDYVLAGADESTVFLRKTGDSR
ncbi:MAG: hypothetical protein IJR36_08490 [Lachnospiraceae bacterium]|nr:hypothetical protein [Lachnospiraceae bacterium]